MNKRELFDLPTGKVVIMGNGDFCVGGCYSTELDMHGLVYMPLPERREPGTPTTDLFPVGSRAVDPAAIVYFKTPAAMRQTMGYLTEKLAELEGKTAGAAMLAIDDVIAERHRQQAVEGWTPEHDDRHKPGTLARAGGSYALNAGAALFFGADSTVCIDAPYGWPFDPEWWKPSGSRRDLVKAAALILAEIERIDRVAIANGDA